MTKSWLITGASSGLGKNATERLLARGDRVAAAIRREGALAELERAYGDRLRPICLDLTDRVGIRATIDAAFTRMGRIDIVLNSAGYGLFGAAEELTHAQIDRQIATNLTGAIELIRSAIPHLRRQGGGRIVQVSSEGGQIAYPNFGLYHATKWGIEGFIEAVAQEVQPFGIDFLIAEPGPTATNFRAALDVAPALSVYDETPASAVRRAVTDGSFVLKGDAGRTADAIIAAADSATPPMRLVLGSTAYEQITAALERRLAEAKGQRAVAVSADRVVAHTVA